MSDKVKGREILPLIRKEIPTMKRTYQLKRTPLAKVSAKKVLWNGRYSRAKRKRMMITTYCQRCHERTPCDGHHPYGQIGPKIMIFVLVCRKCHNLITERPSLARAEGWIHDGTGSAWVNETVEEAERLANL